MKRFAMNTSGRDLAVGDIHGHFSRLQAALNTAGFDPAIDRLFSVGDLVDRGPECQEVIEWLDRPWFHPVQGNHEVMAIDYARKSGSYSGMYLQNGGAWFLMLNADEQQSYAARFASLPIAIEVETARGIVGIVHADCPATTWTDFTWTLLNGRPAEAAHFKEIAQWSRRRISEGDQSQVAAIRAVVVGHTPLKRPVVLGNVHHIDTGGWLRDGSGHFTLLDLATLQPVIHA